MWSEVVPGRMHANSVCEGVRLYSRRSVGTARCRDRVLRVSECDGSDLSDRFRHGSAIEVRKCNLSACSGDLKSCHQVEES